MVVPLFALRLAPGVYNIPAVHAVAQSGVHQHAAAATLSRRRTAGGDLSHRAIARPRRARHRRRSDRDQAAQFHSRRRPCRTSFSPASPTTAATSCASWTSASSSPTGTAFRNARPSRRSNGKLRGRGIGYFVEEAAIFNDRMVHPLRSERHAHHPRRHPFARPGPPNRLRADGARMARRAVRVDPASSRATPTRSRSGAAPTARAACMSAATRSKKPPTPSSRRPSRWRR